jgi:hypothetical protein
VNRYPLSKHRNAIMGTMSAAIPSAMPTMPSRPTQPPAMAPVNRLFEGAAHAPSS